MNEKEIIELVGYHPYDKETLKKCQEAWQSFYDDLPETEQRLFSLYIKTGYNMALSNDRIEKLSLSDEDLCNIVLLHNCLIRKKTGLALRQELGEIDIDTDNIDEIADAINGGSLASMELRKIYEANKELCEIIKCRKLDSEGLKFMIDLAKALDDYDFIKRYQ